MAEWLALATQGAQRSGLNGWALATSSNGARASLTALPTAPVAPITPSGAMPLMPAGVCRFGVHGHEFDRRDLARGRQRVVGASARRVVRAVSGSPAGSCVWHVVGLQRSVREIRQGWGDRLLRQEQAQGILVAALGMLAAHSGYNWAA